MIFIIEMQLVKGRLESDSHVDYFKKAKQAKAMGLIIAIMMSIRLCIDIIHHCLENDLTLIVNDVMQFSSMFLILISNGYFLWVFYKHAFYFI